MRAPTPRAPNPRVVTWGSWALVVILALATGAFVLRSRPPEPEPLGGAVVLVPAGDVVVDAPTAPPADPTPTPEPTPTPDPGPVAPAPVAPAPAPPHDVGDDDDDDGDDEDDDDDDD